jgi:hypothetical protein
MSLSALAANIEDLFVQQFDRIAFHHNEQQNDYRVHERRLSTLMLDKSLPDNKHVENAQAVIKLADTYSANFVSQLKQLNGTLDQKLLMFQNVVHDLSRQKEPPGNLDAVQTWLSLSQQLQKARVTATEAIINRVERDKWIPTVIIQNNGRSDMRFDASQQLTAEAADVAATNLAFENNQQIQREREPLTKRLFPSEVSAAPEASVSSQREPKPVHPLERKAWFRLMKVLYIGLWVTGLGISAVFAYGTGDFLIFLGAAITVAIVLILAKKVFYYVALGRSTALEKPGKGFVDLEEFRANFAGVQGNNPELYREVIAPLFDSWKAQYGRRIPVHEITVLQQRVNQELDALKKKKQQLIEKAASDGATIDVSSLRKRLDEAKGEYKGPDRQEYIQQVDLLIMSLEAKYGTTIPVDEASKLLDKLEEDIRANEHRA